MTPCIGSTLARSLNDSLELIDIMLNYQSSSLAGVADNRIVVYLYDYNQTHTPKSNVFYYKQ